MPRLTITVEEFCHAIGIGRTKTYELIKDGTLETITIGRRRLIKMNSVDALIGDGGWASGGDDAPDALGN